MEDHLLGADPAYRHPISLLFLVLLYYSLERRWKEHGEHSGIMFIFFQDPVYRDRGIYPLRCIFRAVRDGSTAVVHRPGEHHYITMSIFLAFAAIYPDMEVLLYFVLPIKMKWMALVYAVMALLFYHGRDRQPCRHCCITA